MSAEYNKSSEAIQNYNNRIDEELIENAKNGDNKALELLIDKYKSFVRIKARTYFLIGADKEDLVQEGMIGLYKAIRDFKVEKISSFRAFAEICITRQIITAIKTAARQKHMPLNSYISLNKPIFDEDSDSTLMDILCEDVRSDPQELITTQESIEGMENKLSEILSPLEKLVLNLYIDGKSYVDIAKAINRASYKRNRKNTGYMPKENHRRHTIKSIDNAIQRVKKKLEKYIQENDF